jgi:hypothetical protein
MPTRMITFDKLPLFANEEQISAALLGPGKVVAGGKLSLYLSAAGSLPWTAFFDREYAIGGPCSGIHATFTSGARDMEEERDERPPSIRDPRQGALAPISVTSLADAVLKSTFSDRMPE